MDILNALVAFLNFVFIPGVAYGAQSCGKVDRHKSFLRRASCA
jgi:hypothetical protein